ncbi:MAG: nickel pincer cofactor biosynthesis protein LarC [Lachnospiraceae bacterium]|nr:nickel pincer cofactor biosynthesis protein LarC [Lachnospiraceae bacterium]
MKTLYIECGMGAAGDMLISALAGCLGDRKNVEDKLNSLSLPGIVYKLEEHSDCGIKGIHTDVTYNGMEEDEHLHDHHTEDHHDDHHEEYHERHDHHDHHGHHHGGSLHEVFHMIDHASAPDIVKEDAKNIYRMLAEAESSVHGVPLSDIHFHEVGTMDAVADVTAACLLFNEIGAEKVIVSPIHVGAGSVKCAHGILPVPAPATAYILKDVPIYGGEIQGELCTPTGAAILKYFADSFGAMPLMKTDSCGYGFGRKKFERANCVRVFSGVTDSKDMEHIVKLECEIDDMSGEELAYAAELLMEKGAKDVYTVPVIMKKGRSGNLLVCLCSEDDEKLMAETVFKNTSTLGIRRFDAERYVLKRHTDTAETGYGEVRIKVSEGFGSSKYKPEYDDAAKIARENGLSLHEVNVKAGSSYETKKR